MTGILSQAVAELNEQRVIELVKQELQAGRSPVELQTQIESGLKKVGELYEQGEYFIADLIMGGSIYRDVLDIPGMKPSGSMQSERLGKIVLGTVFGDFHDIGKDIFRDLAQASGYEVHDLGINVPVETFVNAVAEIKPDIVGLSGLMTAAFANMKHIVDSLKEAGLRDKVKVLLGGAFLTQVDCAYIGADGFTNDASKGIAICNQWYNGENKA